MTKVGLLALGLAFLVTGCSINISNEDKKSSNTINGKSPEEFYAQLNYRVVDGFHRYLSISTHSSWIRLTTTPDLRATVTLYLFDNKTFKLKYSENAIQDISGNSVQYNTTHTEMIDGTWRIEGTNLVVGNVGVCAGMTFNDQPACSFNLARNIKTAGLAGKTTILSYHSSQTSDL